MNIEAYFELFATLCTLFIVCDWWWRRVFRDRRIATRVKRMYVVSKAIGNPLHTGAILEFAELLGVKLNE
jgi:hypothetical protein